ncbi:hypothetical protein LTR28_000348 [Elasticomyces elasticus]|nr:hypothetical protein LTR28_000348 [Elasticomyces elasticus]
MSTTKRPRRRQSDAHLVPAPPPAKRVKTNSHAHVPVRGLDFLVDESKRAGKALTAKLTDGVKETRTGVANEANARVVGEGVDDDVDADVDMRDGMSGKNVVEISSAEEESSDYSGSDEEVVEERSGKLSNGVKPAQINTRTAMRSESNMEPERFDAVAGAEDATTTNGNAHVDTSDHAEGNSADDDEAVEPSFGDLLRANNPEPIDVQSAFAETNPESRALVPSTDSKTLTAPSATSLGTVLTQALKTNDAELLESCFQMSDAGSIRSTVQRLHSALVATLLQRLAERLHQRPGRAANLMVWVQWSLVAHGGYLAAQPDVVRKLRALGRVVRERAAGLQSLLALKGKLDMLSAQIELRKSMRLAARAADADDEDADAVVLYVEGQEGVEEEESGGEDGPGDEAGMAIARRRHKEPNVMIDGLDSDASDSGGDDDDDAMPTTNGHPTSDSSAEDDEAEEEDGAIFDDEVESTSADDDDDDSDDSSDAQSEEEEIDDDATSNSENETLASSAPLKRPAPSPRAARPQPRPRRR